MSFGKRTTGPILHQPGSQRVGKLAPPAARQAAEPLPAPAAKAAMSPFDQILRRVGMLALLVCAVNYGPGIFVKATSAFTEAGERGASVVPKKIDKNIIDVTAEDAEMNAAMAKARAGIATFWSKFTNPGAGERAFSIKAALPTTNGSLEHIWVADLSRNGDQVSGRLANEPRNLAGLKQGSVVTFGPNQISDWMFQRNGKIVGNETMRPLLARMPPAQAAEFRAMLESP